MHAISAEAISKIREVSAIDFANIAWACASYGLQVEPLSDAISSEVRRNMHQFGSQELSSWLWAFSKLSVENAELLRVICHDAVGKVHEFTAQDLSNLLWSLSRQANALDEPLMHALAAEAKKKINNFSGQNLATVAGAFAKLNCSDQPVLDVVSAAD